MSNDKVDPGGRELREGETVSSASTSPSEETKPMLPPPNYVIQIPKDQIYRTPPPENAYKYKLYTRRAERRRRINCCCFLFWFVVLIVCLAVAAGSAAGVLYLVFRPKIPSYSLESLAVVSGLNLSTPDDVFSPEIKVAVRAENPNDKIGIYYRDKSSIRVFYSDLELCSGKWPAFYHRSKNTTMVHATLVGSKIDPSKVLRESLVVDVKREAVPLRILVHVPVRIKVGKVTTWTLTVKTRCEATVDKLGNEAKIKDGSNKCKVYKVKLFS